MIKIKIIELLNVVLVLNKLYSIDNEKISIQFSVKLINLGENLNNYIKQYSKKVNQLITKNEIEIVDDKYFNKDANKLKSFLEEKNKLDNTELEIEQKKIVLDKNITGFNANELLILKPFFDYPEAL